MKNKINILKSFATRSDAENWASENSITSYDIYQTNSLKSLTRQRIPFGRYHVVLKNTTPVSARNAAGNDELSAEEIDNRFEALHKSGHLVPIDMGGELGTHKVINHGNRKTVVMNVNGVNVPFYQSTGQAGKEGVKVGKWYPFLGIGAMGLHSQEEGRSIAWYAKLGEKEINDYYGIPELKEMAEHLDSLTGNIAARNDLKAYVPEKDPRIKTTFSHSGYNNGEKSLWDDKAAEFNQDHYGKYRRTDKYEIPFFHNSPAHVLRRAVNNLLSFTPVSPTWEEHNTRMTAENTAKFRGNIEYLKQAISEGPRNLDDLPGRTGSQTQQDQQGQETKNQGQQSQQGDYFGRDDVRAQFASAIKQAADAGRKVFYPGVNPEDLGPGYHAYEHKHNGESGVRIVGVQQGDGGWSGVAPESKAESAEAQASQGQQGQETKNQGQQSQQGDYFGRDDVRAQFASAIKQAADAGRKVFYPGVNPEDLGPGYHAYEHKHNGESGVRIVGVQQGDGGWSGVAPESKAESAEAQAPTTADAGTEAGTGAEASASEPASAPEPSPAEPPTKTKLASIITKSILKEIKNGNYNVVLKNTNTHYYNGDVINHPHTGIPMSVVKLPEGQKRISQNEFNSEKHTIPAHQGYTDNWLANRGNKSAQEVVKFYNGERGRGEGDDHINVHKQNVDAAVRALQSYEPDTHGEDVEGYINSIINPKTVEESPAEAPSEAPSSPEPKPELGSETSIVSEPKQ